VILALQVSENAATNIHHLPGTRPQIVIPLLQHLFTDQEFAADRGIPAASVTVPPR
jgi:hypothetical protein